VRLEAVWERRGKVEVEAKVERGRQGRWRLEVGGEMQKERFGRQKPVISNPPSNLKLPNAV